MKFRHNETGQIINGEFEFRQIHPNVSFPEILDQNALDYANVSVIVEVPMPSCTHLQRVDFDGYQLIDGRWTETWSVHNKYDDPEEQAALEADSIRAEWYSVRMLRDQLLKDTDYTDLPNIPITQDCRNNFIMYRQQLRDITDQSDPFNIIWPEIPPYEK